MAIQRTYVDLEMASGEIVEKLQINNPAMVAFDFERAKRNWPEAQTAPLLYINYLAWWQLKHDGRYDQDFKTFREVDCITIDEVKPEELNADDETDVDPTTPGVAQDYA